MTTKVVMVELVIGYLTHKVVVAALNDSRNYKVKDAEKAVKMACRACRVDEHLSMINGINISENAETVRRDAEKRVKEFWDVWR